MTVTGVRLRARAGPSVMATGTSTRSSTTSWPNLPPRPAHAGLRRRQEAPRGPGPHVDAPGREAAGLISRQVALRRRGLSRTPAPPAALGYARAEQANAGICEPRHEQVRAGGSNELDPRRVLEERRDVQDKAPVVEGRRSRGGRLVPDGLPCGQPRAPGLRRHPGPCARGDRRAGLPAQRGCAGPEDEPLADDRCHRRRLTSVRPREHPRRRGVRGPSRGLHRARRHDEQPRPAAGHGLVSRLHGARRRGGRRHRPARVDGPGRPGDLRRTSRW